MATAAKTGERMRSAQRVFVHDRSSVDRGLPVGLLGCPFIFEIGKDFTDENAYLYARCDGTFRKRRLLDPAEWMDRSGGRDMGKGSFIRDAQALSFGRRVLDRLGTDLRRFEEGDFKRVAKLMDGVGPSWTGAVQRALMMAAQNCVWDGKRKPLSLFHKQIFVKHVGTFTSVSGIARARPGPVRYLGSMQGIMICEEIVDPATRLYGKLSFRCGLRPGEGGRVLDEWMPDGSNVEPGTTVNFEAIGKGNKTRFPEIDSALLEEIDHYRTFVRPERVENFMRLNGTEPPPTALLLNTRGNPVSYHIYWAAFHDACEKLGIKGKPHWARHGYAADFMVEKVCKDIEAMFAERDGVTPQQADILKQSARARLSELLGHALESSTDRYTTRVDAALSARLQSMRRSRDQ